MSCETQNVNLVFNDDVNVGLIFDDAQSVALTFNDDQNVALQCEKFAIETYFAQVQSTLGAGNIVAHYKLDETSGTNAADSSGNGYDGTYTNGPTLNQTSLLTQGGGTSVDFDGVNDYVAFGSGSQWDFIHGTGVFSVHIWAEFDSASGFARLVGNSRAIADRGFNIIFNNGGSTQARLFNGSSQFLISATDPADGTHLISLTADGSTMEMYFDAVSQGTVSITPSAGNAPNALNVATDSSASNTWDGRIDEVTIADVHSSGADVTELYSYGTA